MEKNREFCRERGCHKRFAADLRATIPAGSVHAHDWRRAARGRRDHAQREALALKVKSRVKLSVIKV